VINFAELEVKEHTDFPFDRALNFNCQEQLELEWFRSDKSLLSYVPEGRHHPQEGPNKERRVR
jgi:hypothetical protein